MAAPGRSDVNVWPGRWRGPTRPVSTLVSTKWADRAGYPACFTQRFTHDRHAVECAIPPRYAARYALLVRTLALVLGQFAPVVRTLGSQPP